MQGSDHNIFVPGLVAGHFIQALNKTVFLSYRTPEPLVIKLKYKN